MEEAPGFAIPCNPPLLPVAIDLLPNGLLQVAGILTLMRLGAQVQAAAAPPSGVIIQ